MANEQDSSSDGESSRRHRRYRVRLKTLVSAGGGRPFMASLVEISESGLSLVSESSIADAARPGNDIAILFQLPSKNGIDKSRIEVSCRLIHEYFSNGQFRCGLLMREFRLGREAMVSYLSELVD